MSRTEEAMLSRQNMSTYKTLYVEGDLDLNLIDAYFKNNGINNVRIYRIIQDKDNIDQESFNRDDSLGAKKLIQDLIKQSNCDETIEKSKYLGIVDLDFDICFSTKEEIQNLIYTDNNSMESYLIDKELFKVLSSENKCEKFEDFGNNFQNFVANICDLNKMFMFQLKYIEQLEENVIVFDEIKFGSGIIKEDNRICTNTIKKRCKNNKEKWSELFDSKHSEFIEIENNYKSDILILLHGKYTLKYIISLFKKILDIYKQVNEDSIINMLKDKFVILRKFNNYPLFEKINNFATL